MTNKLFSPFGQNSVWPPKWMFARTPMYSCDTTYILWRLLPIISVVYHFLNLFQTKYHSNRRSNRRQHFTGNTYVDSEDLLNKFIGQQNLNHCANRQKHKCLCEDKNRNHVLCFRVTCRSKHSSRQIANLFTHFPKCLLRFLFSQHLIPSFHIVEHEIVGLPLKNITF